MARFLLTYEINDGVYFFYGSKRISLINSKYQLGYSFSYYTSRQIIDSNKKKFGMKTISAKIVEYLDWSLSRDVSDKEIHC